MKTSRTFALVAAALVAGFLAARWSGAQPPQPPSGKPPTSYDFGALQQLESFVAYLQETKQTNILQRFNDYANASTASREFADLGVTVAILQRLRDGYTNTVYELLEGRVDADIIGFAACYRDLPAALRDQTSLKILENARDYRVKFPFKHGFPEAGEGIANAFKMLDANTAK